jgi:hypothetical protein
VSSRCCEGCSALDRRRAEHLAVSGPCLLAFLAVEVALDKGSEPIATSAYPEGVE